jgi:NitT/TauT family transport system substrate-binding protein
MTHARRDDVESLEGLVKAKGTLAVMPGLTYVEHLKATYGEFGAELVTYPGGISQLVATQAEGDYAQQCFVTSEPIAAKQAGIETKVFLVADSGYNPYTSVVIAKRAWVDANPETAQALVAALREGWRAYLDDPTATNAHMHTLNPTLDPETFRLAAEAQVPLIETEATQARGLGDMTLERWTDLATKLKAMGVLKEEPDPAACFVPLPAK